MGELRMPPPYHARLFTHRLAVNHNGVLSLPFLGI